MTTITRYVLAILSAASLIGCAGRAEPVNTPTAQVPPAALYDDAQAYQRVSSSYPLVERGMTKNEVAKLVGYPAFNRDTDVWQWRFRDTGMADLETYRVCFEEGIVTDKQCAGMHFAHPQR